MMPPNRMIVKAENIDVVPPYTPVGGTGVAQQVLRRNGPNDTDMLWQFQGSIPIFATTAARDAAITSPVEGQWCFVADTRKANWCYVNGVWLPFDTKAQSFTPVLTAATTPPTLGTGSVSTAWYFQTGKMVFYQFKIKFGTSGAAPGSGNYNISTPVVPEGTNNILTAIRAFHISSEAIFIAYFSGNNLGMLYPATWPTGAQSFASNASPWVWGNNDELGGALSYIAA